MYVDLTIDIGLALRVVVCLVGRRGSACVTCYDTKAGK
jgi:hypothetical protein